MAIPSINDLITYVNTKITGLNWNANWNKVILWFTDGTADLTVNSVEVTTSFTGDLTGNADTVTNGVYTVGDQTIAGTKTFSSPIVLTDSTDSSSSTTGSFKTAGGLGVAKSMNIGDNLTLGNKFNTIENTATISSGAITYSGMNMVIDTEGAASTDDLTTINGMVAGNILILKIANSARNVVIKNSASLITSTATDVTLDLISDCIIFHHNGTGICEIARGVSTDFKNLKNANGYTYLPNGIIMQWGSFEAADSIDTVVTFPITFPTLCSCVLVSSFGANGADQFANGWKTLSTTSNVSNVTIRNLTNGTNTCYWHVIGY